MPKLYLSIHIDQNGQQTIHSEGDPALWPLVGRLAACHPQAFAVRWSGETMPSSISGESAETDSSRWAMIDQERRSDETRRGPGANPDLLKNRRSSTARILLTLHVALPSPIDKWPMRDRSAPPAPVRRRRAKHRRTKSPKSCARTALAAECRLAGSRLSGPGARTTRKALEAIACLLEGGIGVRNLFAKTADELLRLLGIDCEDKTARRVLVALSEGPLHGWCSPAAGHRGAELRLWDLLQAATAATPRARVTLPMVAPNSSAEGHVDQPRHTPLTGKFTPARYKGTRGVVHAVGVSHTSPIRRPRNPADVRKLLFLAPVTGFRCSSLVYDTLDRAVAAFEERLDWGRGSLREVAWRLVPGQHWTRRRQAERALGTLVRLGALVQTDEGLAFPFPQQRDPFSSGLIVYLAGVETATACSEPLELELSSLAPDEPDLALTSRLAVARKNLSAKKKLIDAVLRPLVIAAEEDSPEEVADLVAARIRGAEEQDERIRAALEEAIGRTPDPSRSTLQLAHDLIEVLKAAVMRR